ncbi:MAG: leucine-rich repeat domain-containing protein, partial [Hungatella hathewayi]|nr:leucine-rich repeat domain-containing protein [Hungatella hathewayi]
MKRNHKRVISTLLIALLISTQPAVMAWADSVAPADHLLGDDENAGKKTGYATPTDADQKDEDALKPDDTPKGDEIPS